MASHCNQCLIFILLFSQITTHNMSRTLCILCVTIITAVMVETAPVVKPHRLKNWLRVSTSSLSLIANKRSSIYTTSGTS